MVVMAGRGAHTSVRHLGYALVVGVEGLAALIRSHPGTLPRPRIEQLAAGLRRYLATTAPAKRPKATRRILVLAGGIALVALAFAFFDPERDPCSGVLSWSEARACVGERVMVRDRVISVRGHYINLGHDFSFDRPRLAINFDPLRFPDVSGEWVGDLVQVEGVVQRQPGFPLAVEIVPMEPSDLVNLSQA